MEILLCVISSAITSIVVVKFFSYKYFEIIDDYVKGIVKDTKESIIGAIDSLCDTTRGK